ncbi:MAG: hypothetical protein ABJP82_04155 [Hyphomicrobiales bacterium]
MQKYRTDTVGNFTHSDQMSVYLAKGRSERSKAFHDVIKGMRSWLTGH